MNVLLLILMNLESFSRKRRRSVRMGMKRSSGREG